MSVLIQGMPMPENCYKCLLNSFCYPCEGQNNICVVTCADLGYYEESHGKVYDFTNGTHDARHPACPLREVEDD